MTNIDYGALAREAGLPRVGARAPLPAYLKEVWERRHFAVTMARFRIQAKLAENRLGIAWVVLTPLLQAAVYGLIFGLIMSSDTRPDPFIPFLVTGFFIFSYFSNSFSQGAKSITTNRSLVRSLSFPRMLLPVSDVLRQIYELVPILVVLVVILVVFGVYPTWDWLYVFPILVLMTMFNTGVALLAARITVHLRDVTQLIPIITRLLFYATGLFYSLELVLQDKPEWIKTMANLNPVYAFVTMVRHALLGPVRDPKTGEIVGDIEPLIVTGAVSAVVFLVAGVIFFWKAEERYGRD